MVIEKILTYLHEKASQQERVCYQKARHSLKLGCSTDPKETNHSTQVTALIAEAVEHLLA